MSSLPNPQRATVGVTLGRAVDATLGGTVQGASRLGKAVGHSLRRAHVGRRRRHTSHGDSPHAPGATPGLESFADRDTPPPPGTVTITVHDYGPAMHRSHSVDDIDAFCATPRPPDVVVRWINVDGLHPYVVKKFADRLNFHTLAAEDTLHVPQRPKAELYDEHLFVVMRMMRLHDDHLTAEQISMFLQPGLVVTFQEDACDEHHGDVWAAVRKRMDTEGSRLRKSGADFLLYALVDAVVDHCFPVLERFGDLLEDLEPLVIENPDPKLIGRIYGIKRELGLLRRVLWPTREMIGLLMCESNRDIGKPTKVFLRDVQEHCVQLVEIIETFRDMTSSLTDLHMSAVSSRMNEVMKVLTIMGTIFIPITFLAGVYGMNFDYLPELHQRWAYPAFWFICIATVVSLLYWFRHRGWIGKS